MGVITNILIAGLPADVDVFEIEGEGFDSMSDDSDDSRLFGG
ncbi:hypothetical protein [Brevibacterium antiquum]|nr:hypothetical protein [Brevibacterium antiquum]